MWNIHQIEHATRKLAIFPPNFNACKHTLLNQQSIDLYITFPFIFDLEPFRKSISEFQRVQKFTPQNDGGKSYLNGNDFGSFVGYYGTLNTSGAI